MKKIILVFAVALFSATTMQAQEFEVGTNAVNFGIGLGGGYYNAASGVSISPGFSVSYERGIWDAGPGVVSLGAFGGYKSYDLGSSVDLSQLTFGVRGAYHYTGFDIDNLDVYGGVAISFDRYGYDGSNLSDYNDTNFGAFIGGRWYFSDTFAVFAEAGYGASVLTLGVSLRF